MLKWKITTDIVVISDRKIHRSFKNLWGNKVSRIHHFELPERTGKNASSFPRTLDIKIYSRSRLGNWILEHLIAKRKLIVIDLNFQGW